MISKLPHSQIDKLIEIVIKNPYNKQILNGNPFPDGEPWYLGAGCVCQSVWNYLSGKNPEDGISDYDLIYYNATDISKEKEAREESRINRIFSSLPIKIEVVNQARVHTWYELDFGKKIDQLESCEDAINQWPTTATSIGVKGDGSKYCVYAPFGLDDLFGMIVRPNKPSAIKWVYEKKVEKWTKIWPNLKVIPWD